MGVNNTLGYIRVSSTGQLDGDGPERQRNAILAFVSANSELVLDTMFSEAVSGTIDGLDRPEFARLLEYIDGNADRRIQFVVIERLDRLARDLMVQEVLIRELAKRQIKLFATDQGLVDLVGGDKDPTRKLIRQVIGALAEWEKSNLVRKLRVARERVKAAKGWCGGNVSYGTLAGEGPVLDLMLSLRGTMTLRQMADVLNDEGFSKRNGKPWTFNAVGLVLGNARGGKEAAMRPN
jgi:DNA invertase Pin-like site-specific DNA recombinase